jgi:hypothetical protein
VLVRSSFTIAAVIAINVLLIKFIALNCEGANQSLPPNSILREPVKA